MITNTFQLSLQPGATPLKVPLSQYDKGETLIFKLRHKATSASISSGVTAEISGTKSDGQGFTHSATYSYSNGTGTVTVTVADDMTDVSGLALCEITLKKGSGSSQQRLSTSNFYLDVETAANSDNSGVPLPATPTISYYNYNGATLLYTETVQSGGNGIYSGRPTRSSSSQYTYTFVGWSWNPNSTSADTNATKGVIRNTKVYAAYSVSTRYYTVEFRNSDGSVLQQYSNVPYGGTVTYSSVPEYVGTKPNMAFDGFEPTGANITGNTICVAQWRDMVIRDMPISDSWEQIFAAEEDRSYLAKYTLGNTKKISIGGNTYTAQIVAINGDELSNNTGKAKITWILKEIYIQGHRFAPSGSGARNWGSSGLRTWLNNTVFYNFPSEIRSQIKEVKKSYYSGTGNGTTQTSNDKLWVPSAREIGDMFENQGIVYDIYKTESARRKHLVGRAFPEDDDYTSDERALLNWWIRTCSNNNMLFIMYDYSALIPTEYDDEIGVCIGFCT